MEELKLEGKVYIYENMNELSPQDNELMTTAIQQLDHAYAPYSNFHVGAAVRLGNDLIFPGCNQENASYPLCMCGERVALYNAASHHPKVLVESLAITIKNTKQYIEKPVSPCGACRQVIAEFEQRHNHPIRILLKSDGPKVYEIRGISGLLPLGFDGSFL